MERKRNRKLLIAAGLVVVIAVGGVFAYFNQTMSVENPFDTGKYDSVLVEDFSPADGENWEPGSEVNKDIEVKNTGDYDVIVRVKFDEKWVNKDTGSIVKENTGMNDSISQASAADGLVAADGSVVAKTLNKADWVYNAADGYWYYKANLTAGASTGKFLDSVKLIEDADMGEYIVTNYYSDAETRPDETDLTQWTKYTGAVPTVAKHTMSVTRQNPDKPGYGNADYTLTITAQTVQATKAAVLDAFSFDSLPDCTWNLVQ